MKMSKEDIEVIVSNIIQDRINKKHCIANDAILLDEGIDSLTIIEVVVKIEESFNFEFEDENLSYKTLRSIDSISEYIYQHFTGEEQC